MNVFVYIKKHPLLTLVIIILSVIFSRMGLSYITTFLLIATILIIKYTKEQINSPDYLIIKYELFTELLQHSKGKKAKKIYHTYNNLTTSNKELKKDINNFINNNPRHKILFKK